MRRPEIAILVLLSAAVAAKALAAGGGYDLSWFTIDAGGGPSAAGGFEVAGTAGQPEAGPELTGGGFALAGGFWGRGAASSCDGDCAGADGLVGVNDLLALLAGWGLRGPCDLDGDGTVGVTDFLAMLAAWGPCP